MSNLVINLRLKGDFIDSFIYMGVLYLIDFDFKVNIYQWNDICDYIEERNGFKNKEIAKRQIRFIKKPTFALSKSYDCIDTDLSEMELNKFFHSSFNIGNYPSDVYVFSHRLHYSCEKGVFTVPILKDEPGIVSERNNKIFELPCFSISPNIGGRIAMATGNDGVHTCSIEREYKRKPIVSVKQVTSKNCIDVDWVNNYLMINNKDTNVIVNEYEKKIYNKSQFLRNKKEILSKLAKLNYDGFSEVEAISDESDLSDVMFKEVSKMLFSLNPKEVILKKDYVYSWSSGDFNFLCDENGTVDVFKDGDIIHTDHFIRNNNLNLTKVRTSGCGTVLEDSNNLMLFNNGNLQLLDNDVVNWRVFPRAKTHSGHLHIIKDDHINIRVYNNDRDIYSSYLSNHND
ncbi:hypothetical protein [Raoultella ornithinolytica]|uniref:hypothetical protein n=1 Tax=Raoultella ornithinolytica TaxID=54291 RepID=UPI000BFF1DFA|nr:hypothetical protein [Raoultella ornithinolytica]ATM20652.1 hypothetical protein CRN13_09665 [Raoultella ornithinolytica]MEB8235151.1 hypothetical protein [Raoultella ornithinolytica]